MMTHRRFASSLMAGAVVLATLLVGAGSAQAKPKADKGPKGPHNLQTWLSPIGTTPGAWGKAKFKFVHKFNRLTVELHGLDAGVYDVLVDGAPVGSVSVPGTVVGSNDVNRLVIDSRSAGTLVFDPRGKAISVVNHGSGLTELAADHFPASKSEEMEKTEIEVDFTNTGVQPDASGEAEFKSFKGRSEFEIKVAGLAPGTYDIVVGGESKAQIVVTSGAEVEVEFNSLAGRDDDEQGDDEQGDDDDQGEDDQDDDGGDLLLNFDPRGVAIAISLGGVDILTIDSFPTN